MNSLLTLVILFLIGTAFFSFITTIFRIFMSLVGSASTSSTSRQRPVSQRADLTHKDSISLKDAFIAHNPTRQTSQKNAPIDFSKKRNQQTRSNQLSSRMQQDAARRRAANLQRNSKRQPEMVRATSNLTFFQENALKQNANHTQFEKDDLTTLVPIEKITSTNKVTHPSRTKKNQFQKDLVRGMIYKEILDKPRSLR